MLAPFFEALLIVLDIVWWLIIISVVASWLVAFGVVNTRNPTVYRILDMLNRATEPLYRPFRRIIPPMGGLDLAPMILILVIYIIQREVQIALIRDFELAAICGGMMSCSTCHVYVDAAWREKMPPLSRDERELLEESSHYDEGASRLSCQIEIKSDLAGLKVTVAPED